MSIELIIALVVAIPVILFPAAFIWFVNVSGLWTVWKESRAREKRRAIARKAAMVKVSENK
jgi:flagellar basal body-associated protein FliL